MTVEDRDVPNPWIPDRSVRSVGLTSCPPTAGYCQSAEKRIDLLVFAPTIPEIAHGPDGSVLIRGLSVRRRSGASAGKQEIRDARTDEVRGEGSVDCRQWCLAGVFRRQQDQAEPLVHAPVVRQAAAEVVSEDQAAARLAARDRLALPHLHARGASGDPRRQEGRLDPPQRKGRRDQGDDHRARRQDPDGEGLPAPRPLRGRDGDGPGVLQAPRGGLPGSRHPRAQRREAAQPRQLHGPARPRLGAHRRPDQPLQHDVRPLLHGRQPGRLRPRAVVGRHQAGARQRDHDQAAPADVGAVLGRRADDVAVLPRCGPLRAQGRLQQRAGGDQRHRVRQEPGVREGGGRGRPALRVPAVRRHRQRGQLASPRRQPLRRQAARDREPLPGRRRHRSGHHDRQRRQQRAGRPRHRVRARQPEADQLPLVPAGLVHRPRRRDHAGAPRGAALHAVAPRARREEPDGHRRADPRLVPDLVHVHLHRLGGRRPRTGSRVGPAHLRLPPELRHRHGGDDRQGNEGSRAGDGVPQGRPAGEGRRAGQRRRARQVPVSGRHGARADAQLRLRSRRRRTSASPT